MIFFQRDTKHTHDNCNKYGFRFDDKCLFLPRLDTKLFVVDNDL